MKKMKSSEGITLLDLTIYMVAIMLVIGILASIRQFFFKNMDVVKETARYAEEFDNFNAYFVKDVKESNDIIVNGEDQTYAFSNGAVYTYRKYNTAEDEAVGDIYRNSVKIATNVKVFNCSKKTIYVNNTQKQLLKVDIVIGVSSSEKRIFSKSIQYTLRYW